MDDVVRVDWRYGEINVFSSDSVIGASLARYGEWAGVEIDFLVRQLKSDSCVIDAGSFIGTHAISFAKHCKDGFVHAFEPQERAFRILTSNVAAAGVDNVYCHRAALSDDGLIDQVHFAPEGQAGYGASKLNLSEFQSGGFKVITVDTLGLVNIDLIKIDVEGLEARVIEGARRTISRDFPLIYAECNSVANGYDLFRSLKTCGYSVFGHLVTAYNPINFRGDTHNIFALPNGLQGMEVALVGIHESRVSEFLFGTAPELNGSEIRNLDDIVLLMLSKPQYVAEVLAHCSNYPGLGLPGIVRS